MLMVHLLQHGLSTCGMWILYTALIHTQDTNLLLALDSTLTNGVMALALIPVQLQSPKMQSTVLYGIRSIILVFSSWDVATLLM